MISKLLVIGAYAAALISVSIGIFCFSSIPTKLGFWRFVASLNPQLLGATPATLYGVPWKYTWEEFYQNDLTGQTAVVTGANAGIGYDLAFSLAKVGASVTLVCRNVKRCEDARSKMVQEAPNLRGSLDTMIMDTSSLASVRAFAEAYVQEHASKKSIDMLFFNAGYGVALPDSEKPECATKTKDEIDTLFQVNYLGHHLLYRLLEPFLSPKARIVHTSSAGSFDTFSYKVANDLQTLHGCSEPFTNISPAGNAYGQSKLAQILWAKAVTRRLGPDSGILANAFHPGIVATSMQAKAADDLQWGSMVRPFFDFMESLAWQSPDGALTGLYLAVTDGIRGKYFHPQAQEVVNPLSLDEKLQDDLWTFSDQLVESFLSPIQLNGAEAESEDLNTYETPSEGES